MIEPRIANGERADEALGLAVAELARQPATDHRAEDADDDRGQAALDAARAHEPARDAQPASRPRMIQPRRSNGPMARLCRGRSAAVRPAGCSGCGGTGCPGRSALDGREPLVGAMRIGGPDPRLALVDEEVHVGAAIVLEQGARELLAPSALSRRDPRRPRRRRRR